MHEAPIPTLVGMSWPGLLLSFMGSVAMGFALGRLLPIRSKSSRPTPSTPSTSWVERHHRLRDNIGIAHQHHNVRAQRSHVQHRTLQMHLSPHFMFNALSSVQWLWSEGKHEEAVQTFGSFIRLWQKHWTEDSDSMQSLNDELASLEEYVHLEAARKGMTIAWDVERGSDVPEDVMVPSLIFQPAVENALWHGFSESVPSPCLQIHVELMPRRNNRDWMCIRVRDNGRGLSSSTPSPQNSKRTSMGLHISRDRLRALDSRAALVVEPGVPPWSTETRMEMPVSRRGK